LSIERREAIELDRGAVAARTFHPKNLDHLAGKRVLLHDLGGCIAAAIIGDALVRTEQVRAVDQTLRLGHGRGFGVVPLVFKALGRGGHGSSSRRLDKVEIWPDMAIERSTLSIRNAQESSFLRDHD
jgi:hypothetical protein